MSLKSSCISLCLRASSAAAVRPSAPAPPAGSPWGARPTPTSVAAIGRARELLVGQRLLAVAQLVDQRRAVRRARAARCTSQLTRGHRRDVARAEALERAHVEVDVVARGVEHRLVDACRRRAASRRCSCTRRSCARRRARARTCRRRSRRRSGSRASAASRTATCSTAVGDSQPWHALGGAQRRDRRRAPVRVAAHVVLDQRRAAPPGRASSRGRGRRPGPSSRSAASSQPGTREPCS